MSNIIDYFKIKLKCGFGEKSHFFQNPEGKLDCAEFIVPYGNIELEILCQFIWNMMRIKFGRISIDAPKNTIGSFIDASWHENVIVEYFMSPKYFNEGLFGLEIEFRKLNHNTNEKCMALGGASLAIGLARKQSNNSFFNTLFGSDERMKSGLSIFYNLYWIVEPGDNFQMDGMEPSDLLSNFDKTKEKHLGNIIKDMPNKRELYVRKKNMMSNSNYIYKLKQPNDYSLTSKMNEYPHRVLFKPPLLPPPPEKV